MFAERARAVAPDTIIDEWAIRLKQARPEVEVRDRAPGERFFVSSHLHHRTGRPYRVRHVPIALQWKPYTKPTQGTRFGSSG